MMLYEALNNIRMAYGAKVSPHSTRHSTIICDTISRQCGNIIVSAFVAI